MVVNGPMTILNHPADWIYPLNMKIFSYPPVSIGEVLAEEESIYDKNIIGMQHQVTVIENVNSVFEALPPSNYAIHQIHSYIDEYE